LQLGFSKKMRCIVIGMMGISQRHGGSDWAWKASLLSGKRFSFACMPPVSAGTKLNSKHEDGRQGNSQEYVGKGWSCTLIRIVKFPPREITVHSPPSSIYIPYVSPNTNLDPKPFASFDPFTPQIYKAKKRIYLPTKQQSFIMHGHHRDYALPRESECCKAPAILKAAPERGGCQF